jgi:serine/threonine protein kinase
MGDVWEAWDERLHRAVAVKRLHAQPGVSDDVAEVTTNRAMREARITARLQHPHAVTVYDVVEHEGQPCLVMQLVPSEPLSTRLQGGRILPVADVASLGWHLASALTAAHRAGIVHRDVKPGNVLLAEDGVARISDFGIAHAMGDVTLTSTGMVTGTPAYLAPEVARGEDSSFPADVFSLGATLYTALEGHPPFGTDSNPMALIHRVASGVVEPPKRSGALTPLLVDMLRARPQDRPTMAEVTDELAAIAAGTAKAAVPAKAAAPTLAATTGMPRATAEADDGHLAAAVPAAAPAGEPDAAEPDASDPDASDPDASDPDASDPDAVEPDAAEPQDRWPIGEVGRPEPDDGSERRRGLWAVLATVLVLALLAAWFVASRNAAPTVADPPASTSASSAPAPASSTPELSGTSSPATTAAPSSAASTPTTPAVAPSSAAPAAAPSVAPSSAAPPAPVTPVPAATPAPTATTPAPATPTAAQLSAAISRYYALLPGGTDQAWPLMTASYQTNKAGGRTSYERFWNQFASVTATDVTATPPSTVVATITYRTKDGQVSRERTTFGMVVEGGVLKINSSTVG